MNYWVLILLMKYLVGSAGGPAALEIQTYGTKAECEAAAVVAIRSFPAYTTAVGGLEAEAICIEVVRP